jgi:hypothetical protein
MFKTFRLLDDGAASSRGGDKGEEVKQRRNRVAIAQIKECNNESFMQDKFNTRTMRKSLC